MNALDWEQDFPIRTTDLDLIVPSHIDDDLSLHDVIEMKMAKALVRTSDPLVFTWLNVSNKKGIKAFALISLLEAL